MSLHAESQSLSGSSLYSIPEATSDQLSERSRAESWETDSAAFVSNTPHPISHTPPSSKCAFPIIIGSLFLGTFLLALDTTIIGTAIPSITSDFQTLDDIAWYGSGYLLTLTALQPTFGKLYTLLNIKHVYLACILVFEVGSILCAAARSSAVFITGRAIAGCGAAGLFQGALVIITNSVALEKRPLYMGIVISAFGICIGIGPVLGGTFAERVSWRWCFWINVPIGAVVFMLLLIFLRVNTGVQKQRSKIPISIRDRLLQFDPLGAVLIIAAICSLLLALQWGEQTMPWDSAKVIGLCIGSGLMFCAFFLLQWKLGDRATLPLSVLKQRSILSGALFMFFFGMPINVYGYYLPIYFQSVKGSSAVNSGTNFLAFALPDIVAIGISGALATRFGYYTPYIIGGVVISIVGSALITTLEVGTATEIWATFLVICGIGTGMAINLPYTAVQAVLSEEGVPTGNAILQFSFQLGASIALCIAQTLFIDKLTTEVRVTMPGLPPAAVVAAGASNIPAIGKTPELLFLLREAYRNAIRNVFIFVLAAACLGLVFAFGFEHRNVKAVAGERASEKESLNMEKLAA